MLPSKGVVPKVKTDGPRIGMSRLELPSDDAGKAHDTLGDELGMLDGTAPTTTILLMRVWVG